MRVVVEGAVFAALSNTLALAQLLNFAVDRRHTILIQPDFQRYDPDSAINRWLMRQSQELREAFQLGLETSLQAEARDFDRDVTVLISAESQPATIAESTARIFRLPLAAANAFLAQPLRILVENARNDRAFILRMLPTTWRDQLEQYEAERWVEFVSGGGLGELKKSLQILTTRPAHERSRRIAIFDSDAREPRKPSKESESVRDDCQRLDVACHQLARRAAENYIPLPALLAWTSIIPQNTPPTRCLQGFRKLNAQQRHHFNMRDGLKKDAKAGVSPLYHDLPAEVHENLLVGFGDKVCDLFAHDQVTITDAWLDEDGLQNERNALTQAIFRRL